VTEPTWERRACVLCAARDRVRRLDAGHVCPECVAWLTGTLRAVSDLVAQAAVAGDRQRVGSSTGKPVVGSRPPMDVECLDPDLTLVRVCDAPPYPTLLEVLEAWERLVREARTLAPYGPASLARGGASVHGSVGFLVASAEWMTTDPGFPLEDFAVELRACLRALLGITRAECASLERDGDADSLRDAARLRVVARRLAADLELLAGR